MGTSQSSRGPGSLSPFVPPWADDQPQRPIPNPEPARFKPFRQSLGRFISSGDHNDLKRAMGHYASKSTGGSAIASRRMGSVTYSGANLFGLLSGEGVLSQHGEISINLDQLAGQPCELAITTITQALTPNVGDSEKIRVAMNHALVEALDGVDSFDASSITDVVLVDIMISYLSESIFLQIVMDAGNAWNKAVTPKQVSEAESDLRELIRVVVDKNLAPKINKDIRSLAKSAIVQFEKEVIIEVWREWEGYL